MGSESICPVGICFCQSVTVVRLTWCLCVRFRPQQTDRLVLWRDEYPPSRRHHPGIDRATEADVADLRGIVAGIGFGGRRRAGIVRGDAGHVVPLPEGVLCVGRGEPTIARTTSTTGRPGFSWPKYVKEHYVRNR